MNAWMDDSFSIVLPTLNESENILPMMEALDRLYPNAGIIVVDDHSKDGTADIALEYGKRRANVQVVRRDPDDRGFTASIVDGIMHATTKYFVVLDSDFQHPPESIAGLVKELMNGSDMAIGVRQDKMELSSRGSGHPSVPMPWPTPICMPRGSRPPGTPCLVSSRAVPTCVKK